MTSGVATKYYYSGGQRIAMRKNGTLYYLFTDHLGSTSLTTDSAGNVVSEMKYKPWGETRYASGVTPTQYQYTSQYSYESDFGLLFFNARWLDPSTGRFAQADTLIPQGQGVQAWDRYAFVNNNPVKYTDPSGHKACDDFDSQGNCVKDELGKLLDFVYDKVLNNDGRVKKKFTALGAMNMIVRKAANLYGNDWDSFLKATNFVFLGTYSNSPYTMAAAHFTEGFRGITFFSDSGDTGFHDDFQQGGDNQVRHFWAAFATAANGKDVGRKGVINAQYGNFYHDVVEDWLGHADTTYSDYTLSIVAIDIAEKVNAGPISSPSALPGVFDATIGVNSPGYTGSNLQWLFFTPDN